MPIGLLTDIAKSFSISEAKAGMLITVYSWIVMLLSLPLMLLVSKIDYKKLFMGTVALFGICQVLTVLSNSYGMLMASRIGVAVHMRFSGQSRLRLQCVWHRKNISPKHSVWS